MNIPSPDENAFFQIAVAGAVVRVPRHCPHRAGRLDHGHIDLRRMTLTCPLHRSVFCLRSGAQLAGPACEPLALLWNPKP